ncbi:ArsI/CadI family heavy metal resistance metalloenzyme [Nitrospina watsonii]|uniref:VOC domain-containing protein n=1 Tax=Nitrospina watsonii TaxID=1323948 RepID=A0ABM9HAH0_9BACT|nr:ArsI/CadI family heavy metal resistance metalloenzyme [Nitrospina watsonii]CAI2717129.1 VOC domain-containing protein [Nitrospina watsonii]
MNSETDSRLHLALNTAHFDDSVRFYEALFGVPPTKLKDGYAKFDVERPALNFTLNRVAEVTGNRVSHLGIQVPLAETVLEETVRLETLGLLPQLEQGTECCYAVQDKVWVDDPDGNAWEVFVVLQQIEEHHGNAGCCRN